MGFNKLIYSLILLSILLSSIIQPAAALSDLAGAGLDIVTEIANSQDAVAGVEKYSKDKYGDWMWEAAGGYENIVSGNLVGESYIEQIKGKFDTIQTVLQGISDFALAIDSGRYDEALYHTVETAVNTVDHPLVSATWAAAKLTYQSHMMVKITEAERQIAILFNNLHKDRRLFEGESNGMKQIPIDTETVDYFFNKYIVTDPSGRGMVRAYVEQRLGEDWPEESWGSWLSNLRAIGSGIDTAEAAETEALTGQYKNTARRWIKRLMEDVNLEAQRWYSEKELRKLMAEFEVFRSEFNTFDANIDDMFRDFMRKKEIEANTGFYNDFLKKSEDNYKNVVNRFEKAEDNKRSLFSGLYNEAKKREMDCVSYRSQVRWAGMKSLADSFLTEIRKWTELKDKIYDNMPPVVSDPEEAYFETYAEEEYKPRDWEIISAMTEGLLEEPDFIRDKSRAEDLKNEYINALTDKDDTSHYQEDNDYFQVKNTLLNINRLNSIVDHDWAGYYNQCNNELNNLLGRVNVRNNLYKNMLTGGSSPQTDINLEDEQAVRSFDVKAEEAVELAKSGFHWSSNLPRLNEKATEEEIINFKLAYVKEAGKNAREMINETVVVPASIYLQETDQWFKARHSLLQQRINQRKEQYYEIENKHFVRLRSVFIDANYNQDLRRVEALTEAVKSLTPVSWLRESEKWARGQRFNSYNGVSAKNIDISDILENDAEIVLAEAIGYDYITDLETGYLPLKTQAGEAENIMEQITFPTIKEEQEIRELVDKDFSVDSLEKLKSEIQRLSGETQLISEMLSNIELIVKNDYGSRLRTADWLQDTAYRMDLLFEDLQSSGLIKDRFTLSLPEGYAYIGENARQREKSEFDGMILAAEPYPHLMKEGEISGLQSDIINIKNKFNSYSVLSFYSTYAREAYKTFNDILALKRISDKEYHPPIKAVSEDIIVHPVYMLQENTMESLARAGNFAVITGSNLTEAEKIIEELSDIVEGEVNKNYRLINEKEFIDNIRAISEILPLTVEINTSPASKDTPIGGRVSLNEKGEKVMAEVKYLIKDEALVYLKEFPAAEKYKQIVLDLKEILYKYHHRAEEEYRKETERLIPYDELAYKIEGAIDSVEFFIMDKDYENAILYEQELEELKSEYRALPGEDPGSRCPELLAKLESLIKEAEDLIGREDDELKEVQNQIREFYDLFTSRYQSRDEYGVLSLLADEWEAADGTTLWDLEDTLIRNFRVFDSISYQITNLEIVENKGDDQYLVNYQLKIVSEIFDRNIHHEEMSSVREIVEIKENGTGQILRTLGGRFWRE